MEVKPAIFTARLQQLLKESSKSANQIAIDLGVSKQTVSGWNTGRSVPTNPTIVTIANYFSVDASWMFGYDVPKRTSAGKNVLAFPNKDYEPLPALKKVPFRGNIACGVPILATEEVDQYMSIPASIKADFCLRCKGDSMIGARIYDGDIVYIRSQPDAENGEIVAIEVNGEATLKRIYKICVSGRLYALELRAENPSIPPLYYEGDDLNNIRIDGKAVYFISAVR